MMLCSSTCFFRESFARSAAVFHGLADRARRGAAIRIWSAGCSTGEEAYSVAMIILDLCPEAADLRISILATDIDPANLITARAGWYPDDRFCNVPNDRRDKWFRRDGDGWRVVEALAALVDFEESDLSSEASFDGPFEVILCCNVAYHLDQTVRERVWVRLADALAPAGHLFVGSIDQGWRAEMLEAGGGKLALMDPTVFMASEPRFSYATTIRAALESAGVEFIPENGGGAGVRLRK